jgi:hypothetical protein
MREATATTKSFIGLAIVIVAIATHLIGTQRLLMVGRHLSASLFTMQPTYDAVVIGAGLAGKRLHEKSGSF